jgi:hypothetical protein
VDMPLRLDNASALPTCPQLQQKQQQTADRNWPRNHPHDCAKKQNKEDLTFSDVEIDAFLPDPLKRTSKASEGQKPPLLTHS